MISLSLLLCTEQSANQPAFGFLELDKQFICSNFLDLNLDNTSRLKFTSIFLLLCASIGYMRAYRAGLGKRTSACVL